MAFAPAPSASEPLNAINTTPLIDVLLVLLIMLIMSIPLSDHSTDVDLPRKIDGKADPVSNRVAVTADGLTLWNGSPVTKQALTELLLQTRSMPVEPELQFEPEANASYGLSASVLHTIKASGVTKIGFVGNEKYRQFDRPG
jgi:biopolymer transport protein ExbD